MLRIVAACDAFILPSIKGESITKSVIEAMALGVTPIISDIRGNVELVENEKSGLVFPSKNVSAIAQCIMQAYNHRENNVEMGKNAQNRIKNKLNHSRALRELKVFYDQLVPHS